MQSLNLPDQNLKVEEIDSKKYIFDFTRKKNLNEFYSQFILVLIFVKV